ncbi:MAG: hypothetical protein JSV10_08170 [Candidatus Zixiibacteriota bacterium]|nr:MAG: hypothetical protein JSV10_08170 [candidate division Zixibacteria bacterium]
MKSESLRQMIPKELWQQFLARMKTEDTIQVLHRLFDYVTKVLANRTDEIKADDGRAISFFHEQREFLTINVTRKDLRIYVHPKAGVYFDPKAKFAVEKFRFWETSYHKASGKYRALSFWISEKEYLPAAKKIIDMIP